MVGQSWLISNLYSIRYVAFNLVAAVKCVYLLRNTVSISGDVVGCNRNMSRERFTKKNEANKEVHKNSSILPGLQELQLDVCDYERLGEACCSKTSSHLGTCSKVC